MKIIENKGDVADSQIYNIGNPKNNYSVRELATMMLKLAKSIPEYSVNADKVQLIETTAGEYYGKGYQDVQNRVPKITNTMKDLDWAPTVNMDAALKNIFEAYRGHADQARQLMD
jgi:nucleoside-diphosphate-sugar epimerase